MDEKSEDTQKGQDDESLKDLDVAEEDAEEVKGGAADKASPIDKSSPDKSSY